MDIKFSEDLEEYRARAKEWLQSELPNWWHDYVERVSDQERYDEFIKTWDKRLYEAGYSGISSPKEYGGQGESVLKEMLFEEELGRIDAPKGISFLGKILLSPTLLTYGTEEQKKEFLPGLYSSEDVWCQGFSEPNAGSDLAALDTKAELDGDEWVISGQKVWTSVAQDANWCFLLARTDSTVSKHKGITYFLVPMDAEGVSIRPLRKITGEYDFNEVFFDNVRIPKDNYIGKLNEGWKVAMTTLSFERGILALGRQSRFQTEFEQAIKYVEKNALANGQSIKSNDYFRQKIAQTFMELRIMRYHSLKTISDYYNNDGKLGPEVSLQKLYWSDMRGRLGELLMELLGQTVYLSGKDSRTADQFSNIYYTALGEKIYAGTNQIQRNVIAERVLNLPR